MNPGLRYGYPDLDSLRQLAREARERPADRAAFMQFHLGIRQEHSVAPFVEMSRKPSRPEGFCGRRHVVDHGPERRRRCSPRRRRRRDGPSVLFVPREKLQSRADRDGVPYVRWAEQGLITATDGNAIDYRVIEQKIRWLHQFFDVQEDAFDKAFAQPVMGPLLDDGFPVITMQRGWVTQPPALNLLERAIDNRQFRHGGHPVLRWNFENVVVHTDSAGNRVMHKGKSRDRIDGAAATWMAVSRAPGAVRHRNIYEYEGAWSAPLGSPTVTAPATHGRCLTIPKFSRIHAIPNGSGTARRTSRCSLRLTTICE